LKALSIHPPLHPLFPYDEEQSTNYDSERSVSPLPARKTEDSMAPVAENAQHEPQFPWFLTEVTAPFEVQLIAPALGVLFSYLSPVLFPT